MSIIAIQLGQRIRQLRTDNCMSQEELAFKSGISPAHLGQIERATKKPTVDTVGKIAAALNVAPAVLFSDEVAVTSAQPLNTTIDKINAHLLVMPEEEQKDILRIIRILHNYERKSGLSETQPEAL